MNKCIEEVLYQVKKDGFVKVNNNQSYQVFQKGTIQVDVDIRNGRVEFKDMDGGRI